MGNVPNINELLRYKFETCEKVGPSRDLEKDLEDVLKSENDDDFISLPTKLSSDGLKIDLESLLNSDEPILGTLEQQRENKRNIKESLEEKMTSKNTSSQNDVKMNDECEMQSNKSFDEVVD